MRWQDPKIEKRSDVARPYWFIRPVVPIVASEGIARKQRPIRLGFCDEMGERKAKQAKQSIMATVNQGKFLVECQLPFAEVLERYIDGRLPQLGAATQAKYRNHIEKYIRPAFGSLRMADIDAAAVQVWLNELAKPRPKPRRKTDPEDAPEEMRPGLSWATRTDLRNIMSAIFTQAAAWKLWDGPNPIADVRVGRQTAAREKQIPKAGDFKRLLAALPDGVRFIVLIAAFTGLSVSEVLGLKWSDIDMEAGTLTVRRRWWRGDLADPKTANRSRVRQLGPFVSEFQKRLGEADAFIFAADGTEATLPDDRNLNQHFLRKAAKRLGIYHPGFGFHTFRRLYISWRQEVGGSPFEAMIGAGHARPSTTWLYTLADSEREKEQVGKMVRRVN